jgi:predicted outer membrane repeat protein
LAFVFTIVPMWMSVQAAPVPPRQTLIVRDCALGKNASLDTVLKDAKGNALILFQLEEERCPNGYSITLTETLTLKVFLELKRDQKKPQPHIEGNIQGSLLESDHTLMLEGLKFTNKKGTAVTLSGKNKKSLVVKESIFTASKDHAIETNATTIIQKSTFSDHGESAIYFSGGETESLTITGSTFKENGFSKDLVNHTADGGAIKAVEYKSLTIESSEFIDNEAQKGGAVVIAKGKEQATITNSVFKNNTANVAGLPNPGGGAILSVSDLKIVNSSFISNGTINQVGIGGAIYAADKITIVGSTFTANLASDGGGIASTAQAVIVNSTFSNNSAKSDGGGLHFGEDTAGSRIINATITRNKAGADGGGVYVVQENTANVEIANTIIAANKSPDAVGNVTSKGHNLVGLVALDDNEKPMIFSKQGGDIFSTDPTKPLDPQLNDLANNNNSIVLPSNTTPQTHLPKAGSPAIDKGNNQICAAEPVNNRDQRTFVRPAGKQCDIGAVEVDAKPAPPPVPTATPKPCSVEEEPVSADSTAEPCPPTPTEEGTPVVTTTPTITSEPLPSPETPLPSTTTELPTATTASTAIPSATLPTPTTPIPSTPVATSVPPTIPVATSLPTPCVTVAPTFEARTATVVRATSVVSGTVEPVLTATPAPPCTPTPTVSMPTATAATATAAPTVVQATTVVTATVVVDQ